MECGDGGGSGFGAGSNGDGDYRGASVWVSLMWSGGWTG